MSVNYEKKRSIESRALDRCVPQRLTEHGSGQREIVIHELTPGNHQRRGGVIQQSLLDVDDRRDGPGRRQREPVEGHTWVRDTVLVRRWQQSVTTLLYCLHSLKRPIFFGPVN